MLNACERTNAGCVYEPERWRCVKHSDPAELGKLARSTERAHRGAPSGAYLRHYARGYSHCVFLFQRVPASPAGPSFALYCVRTTCAGIMDGKRASERAMKRQRHFLSLEHSFVHRLRTRIKQTFTAKTTQPEMPPSQLRLRAAEARTDLGPYNPPHLFGLNFAHSAMVGTVSLLLSNQTKLPYARGTSSEGLTDLHGAKCYLFKLAAATEGIAMW